MELGFSAFFLNRTNRSGIISKAGPIGGLNQNGNYSIDVRFNKEDLIRRIRKIAEYKNKIHLYNQDAKVFITKYLPKYINNAFVYFDPPYYSKGKDLYQNFYTAPDHKDIYDLIKNLNCPWIVTYDDVPEIRKIYSAHSAKLYDLVYSLANSGINSEIMVLSDKKMWPTKKMLEEYGLKINLRRLK